MDFLSKPFCKNDEIADALLVLACFPDGCSAEIITEKNVEKGLELLLRHSYGELIRELPNKEYVLIPLQDKTSSLGQSAIENRLIQFRNRYSPDKNHATMAYHAFMRFVIPKLFEGWIIPSYDKSLSCKAISDGNTLSQPQRKVKINIVEGDVVNPDVKQQRNNIHFQINFLLNYISDSNFTNKFVVINQAFVAFHIDLIKSAKAIKIPVVNNDIVPTKLLSPLFVLSFLSFIKDNEDVIPQAEKEELNHLIDYLSDDLASMLLNSNTITYEDKGQYQLNNAGKFLIQELANKMAKTCFPDYYPLQVSTQWENRLNSYLSLLNSELISLKQKMGLDYLIDEKDRKQARKRMAELLGQSPTTVDNYMQSFNILFDLTKYDLGKISLMLHPIEAQILDMLKQNNDKSGLQGRQNYISLPKLTQDLLNEGYLKDEIDFIVKKLGVSRKLFETSKIDDVEVIIQKFMSLEDYNKRLTEKLKVAKEIYESLKVIKSYDNPIDLNQIEERIMLIESELDADQISRDSDLFKNYSRRVFDGYISSVKEKLEKAKEVNQSIKNYLASHKGILFKKINSNVSWVSICLEFKTKVY